MDQLSVSIIIPVLNAEAKIEPVLIAIKQQSYPFEWVEVLMIDNGSTDQTAQKIKEATGVTYLAETEIQNPYAARNRGFEKATGDLMVLLDINCTPVPEWLEAGVERLQNDEVDLVGGDYEFLFSDEETLGEWYDSLLFLDMEKLIERGRSCAGGNLFFKRKVLDAIGPFPEDQRSGSDLYWTKKASNHGFNLVFEPRAKASYAARPLGPLLKKVFRVGTGQPKIWLDNGRHPLKMAAAIVYQLVPPGTKELKDKIKRRGKDEMNDRFGALWGIHYLQQLTIALGWSKGFAQYYLGDQ